MHVGIVGGTATGAMAYIAGVTLTDERTGEIYDYSDKKGEVVYTHIFAPEHAPVWCYDHVQLAHSLNQRECRRDAQIFRALDMSLPTELTPSQHIVLVEDFVKNVFVAQERMVAIVAIHDDGSSSNNPNVHVLLPMRPLLREGTWGEKARLVYQRDAQGQKIKLPSGNWKTYKERTTTWDNQDNVEKWRQAWASSLNTHFHLAGLTIHADLRSYVRQGIDLLPTLWLNRVDYTKHQRGERTEKGDINQQRKIQNTQRQVSKLLHVLHALQEKREQQQRQQAAEALTEELARQAAQATALLLKEQVVPRWEEETRKLEAATGQQDIFRELAAQLCCHIQEPVPQPERALTTTSKTRLRSNGNKQYKHRQPTQARHSQRAVQQKQVHQTVQREYEQVRPAYVEYHKPCQKATLGELEQKKLPEASRTRTRERKLSLKHTAEKQQNAFRQEQRAIRTGLEDCFKTLVTMSYSMNYQKNHHQYPPTSKSEPIELPTRQVLEPLEASPLHTQLPETVHARPFRERQRGATRECRS